MIKEWKTYHNRFAAIFILVLIIIYCISSTTAFAATMNTINVKRKLSYSSTFSFKKSNLSSITWNTSNHKQETKGDKTIYAVKIGAYGKAATYTGNICTAHFKNVGSIGGKKVNCDVTFSNFHTNAISYKGKGEKTDGYIGLFYIFNNTDSLGIGPTTNNSSYGYWASKRVDYTVKFMYEDGTVVNLPFIELVVDIDSSYKYYQETWEALSGHTGSYCKYATKTSTGEALNSYTKNGKTYSPYPMVWTSSGNNYKAQSPKYVSFQYDTSGNDEVYCSGFYTETTNGSFKDRYYFGNCGMALRAYNQYSSNLISNPTKTSDKASVTENDTFTYTIKHKMGILYESVIGTYKNIEISDKIPEEFSYVSAVVTDGSGKDITSSGGTLNYDESTNTVKYVFNKAWVDNKANYNGQTITMKINVKTKPVDAISKDTVNKAEIKMENSKVSITSSEAKVEVINNPKLQIIKKIRLDDIYEPHGKEVFIFKVKELGSGKEWYRSLTFDDNDKSSDGYWSFSKVDGQKIATGIVEEFPYGEYDISEIKVSRYTEKSKNKSQDGRQLIFTFENEKDNWKYFSHNDIVINTLKKGN